VFGCLGDARWASIYAVAAGATLLWTATWWGTGIPWDAGVDPATVPAGSVAGLGLATWVVLGSWVVLGLAHGRGRVQVGRGRVGGRRGQRPVALVSLRVALGLPDRGPEGRILVATTRGGPVGFLVDEVVRVLRYDPAVCVPEATRPSGYVTAGFQALGASWLLIDWDAIRLPTGITAPR
jgi:CheW-like domain